MKHIVLITILTCQMMVLNHSAFALKEAQIHGFISQGHLKSNQNNLYGADTENGTFEFNEMGINFTNHIADGLILGIQFFARDLGDFGNDELIIDWAYADYFYRKWFRIKAGKLNVYHGLYNDTRDIDMLRVSILLPQCAYPELFRDVFTGIKGVGVYGDLPMGLSYYMGSGVIELSTESAFFYTFSGFFQTYFEYFSQENYYNSRLVWHSPLSGLTLGATLIHTHIFGEGSNINITEEFLNDTGNILENPFEYFQNSADSTSNAVHMKYNIFTFSLEYTLSNLMLMAEYSENRLNFTNDTVNPFLEPKGELRTGGYYAALSYRFNSWFETGIYYSELYYDLKEKEDARHAIVRLGDMSYFKDMALSLRFDMNDHFICKLEWHMMKGTYFSLPTKNHDSGDHWYLSAVKFSYNF